MPVIRTSAGHNINDTARRVAEFRLVSARHHLKFQNRVLIELRRRSPVEIIAVRQPVDEIQSVPTTFSQNRRRVITRWIALPIQRDAWNELQ